MYTVEQWLLTCLLATLSLIVVAWKLGYLLGLAKSDSSPLMKDGASLSLKNEATFVRLNQRQTKVPDDSSRELVQQ
jgi:hypothetical protein